MDRKTGRADLDRQAREKEENREQLRLCGEIRRYVEDRLAGEIPSLAFALPGLPWKAWEGEEREKAAWGTDGRYLYYVPERLLQEFLKDGDGLCRAYLHTLFHCLYLHPLGLLALEERKQEGGEGCAREWVDLACDLAVEWAIFEGGWFLPDGYRRKKREAWYREIERAGFGRDALSCLRWLGAAGQERPGLLEELQRELALDSHRPWPCKPEAIRGEEALAAAEEQIGRWGRARMGLSLHLASEGSGRGEQGKTGQEYHRPQVKKVYDYRRFLMRFARCREELELDLDSFAPIPYYYGLSRYQNLLFLEPSETKEAHRLEELVIAIDTSGSCSGEVVRGFLDETYRILNERTYFFRRMNVHLIQCDSMIQDHQRITCREEWEAYRERVKIQGFGGTDFTPVFRLVESLQKKGELRQLKGLLYFTDGAGVYPRKKPPYDTAFVFLNHRLEKEKVPDWAIRLNLNLNI